MLTALLVGVLGTQTVTFTHPCANASVVLEALGKNIGIKMAAGGSVTEDFIALKFTDRALEDIKRVMSETLNADWYQRGEYLVFERNAKHHALEMEEEDAALRAGIEDAKLKNPVLDYTQAQAEDLVIKLASLPEGSWPGELFAQFRTVSPEKQLQSEIIRAFDVEQLVAVPEGKTLTLTYSPAGASTVPSQMVRAFEDFVGRAKGISTLLKRFGDTGLLPGFHSVAESSPLRFDIEVTKFDGNLMVWVKQKIDLETEEYRIPMTVQFAISKAPPVRLGEKPDIPLLKSPLELSDRQRSLVAVMYSSAFMPVADYEPTARDTAEALRVGTQLDKVDLLTVYGDVPLFAVAREAERDFVALIPDFAALDSRWMGYAKDGTINQVWSWWLQRMTLREDQSTGIMKIQPRSALFERLGRFDRRAVADVVREFSATGRLTLETISALAKNRRDITEYRLSLDVYRRIASQEEAEFGSFTALKLFGQLSEFQRRSARGGGAVVPWQSLRQDTRDLLETALTESFSTFLATYPRETAWNANQQLLPGEYKEGLLAGKRVPESTIVHVLVHRNSLYKSEPGVEGVSDNLLDVNQFAGYARRGASYPKVAVINVDRLRVIVEVPGIGFHSFEAQTDDMTANTKFVAVDKIPEPFRTELTEAIKRAGGSN